MPSPRISKRCNSLLSSLINRSSNIWVQLPNTFELAINLKRRFDSAEFYSWYRGTADLSPSRPNRHSWVSFPMINPGKGVVAMKFPRRRFLRLAAGTAALPTFSRLAQAQAYPSRPVRIINGFPPGGVTDILVRLIAQRLSDRLGQPFLVENRMGAGTNIATEAVANAPPDGYTFLVATAANAINATLYEKLNFNFIRDLAPVASFADAPQIMVVNPAVPAKTVSEFIAYAKANPGKIIYASGGVGSPPHAAGELFKMMAGVNMTHVPYRGTNLAIPDMISGHVQVIFAFIPDAIEYIRAGDLRAL